MEKEYICKTCKKKLSCYKSLWRHNKTFHENVDKNFENKINRDNYT